MIEGRNEEKEVLQAASAGQWPAGEPGCNQVTWLKLVLFLQPGMGEGGARGG